MVAAQNQITKPVDLIKNVNNHFKTNQMKRLTNVEKAILKMGDHDKYNSYRCDDHGVFQIRKDIPEEKQVCPYCKKLFPALSEDEIRQLIEK